MADMLNIRGPKLTQSRWALTVKNVGNLNIFLKN